MLRQFSAFFSEFALRKKKEANIAGLIQFPKLYEKRFSWFLLSVFSICLNGCVTHYISATGGVALHGAELNLENTRFPLPFLVIFLPQCIMDQLLINQRLFITRLTVLHTCLVFGVLVILPFMFTAVLYAAFIIRVAQ